MKRVRQSTGSPRARYEQLYRASNDMLEECARQGRFFNQGEVATFDSIQDEMDEIEASLGLSRTVPTTLGASRSAGANRQPQSARRQSLGSFAQMVARAANPDRPVIDPRLMAGPTGMSEGVASDGGFLVQQDVAEDLLDSLYTSGDVASRVTRISIGPNSNGIKMNGVDETSRANGSRWGGIRAYWTGEAQLLTASQPKFRKIGMDLEKLTGLCYVTDELLQDSTALGAWLERAFVEELTFKVEDAIINGLGTGMPLGFLNSGAVVTVSKEASQVSATIVAENILKMWSRMPTKLRKNAVWLCNQDIEPQLYQLNVKIKNVAGSENVGGIAAPQVVFVPPGERPGQDFGLLMGRPVIPVEYCPSLGTAGDIMLVDLSQYIMIDKGAVDAQQSIHVRFLYDETAFRFIYRVNGQPLWTSPMTPFKGTNTQSPFILLENR